MTPLCELCRKAPAGLTLTYSSKCAVVQKPVCDPCARALQLPHPFTLKPLAPKNSREPGANIV